MANPLTFIMPLAPDADLQQLGKDIAASQSQIDAALVAVGTVHYARFLLLDGSSPNLQPAAGAKGPFSLAVITDYDGDFNIYIQAFVTYLGPIFDVLLSFSAGDGPKLIPVKDHLTAFTAYVGLNDASQQPPNNDLGFYNAYPWTVQQVLANAPS
jgi:hypothetical protein